MICQKVGLARHQAKPAERHCGCRRQGRSDPRENLALPTTATPGRRGSSAGGGAAALRSRFQQQLVEIDVMHLAVADEDEGGDIAAQIEQRMAQTPDTEIDQGRRIA